MTRPKIRHFDTGVYEYFEGVPPPTRVNDLETHCGGV